MRIRTSVVAAMAIGIGFMGLLAPKASAADSANTLKISPVRLDVEINPGESKTVQVTVTNLTDEAIAVHPVENDFIAGDENGTPSLILDENKFAPTHSLKRFMKPIADVTIPAGKSQLVDVKIAVPKDAQAGGYFGAVRFAPATLSSGGQVNLNASAASLILMTVPGDTVEKLNLTNFDIQQNGKTGTSFGTPDHLQLSARFTNNGNVQAAPFGKITVKQGNKVVYETDFNNNNPRDMTLPDSARRWNVPLKNIGTFGNYTVVATFTYGKSNKTIDVSKSFWVVPRMAIILGIVGVVVLIGLIVGIWWFLRSYKRRILRSHGGGSGLGMRR